MSENDGDLLRYYAQAGPMTDHCECAALFKELPKDIVGLRQVVQGLMVHIFWAERYGLALQDERKQEVQIRPAGQKVACILSMDGRPLSGRRPSSRRGSGILRRNGAARGGDSVCCIRIPFVLPDSPLGFQIAQQGMQSRIPLFDRQAVITVQPVPDPVDERLRDRFVSRVLAPGGGEIPESALDALILIPHFRFVAEHLDQGFDYGNHQFFLPLGRIYRLVSWKTFLKNSKDPTTDEHKPSSRKGQKRYPLTRT